MKDTAAARREVLLDLRGLTVTLNAQGADIRPVNDIDLQVRRGQRVALVGESGSGKSMTARAIMNLIPPKLGGVTDGVVEFRGEDLRGYSRKQLNGLRGRDMTMVFQDPMAYLNPVMKVSRQIGEAIALHEGRRAATKARIKGLLTDVGLRSDDSILNAYPHNLSGGMRQRVLLAIALACSPEFMILDEPTTALDVTVQAQVLQTLRDICAERDLSILFITHDLAVVAQLCDYVYVMYAGEVVEHGPIEQIFDSPQHPYTQGLLGSVFSLEAPNAEPLLLKGSPPNIHNPTEGCRFAPRCPVSYDRCRTKPTFFDVDNLRVACWRRQGEDERAQTSEGEATYV